MYQFTKPDNIVEVLEKSISKFSQRPYLGTKNVKLKQYDWITYSDFGKRVDNVRSGLSQLGIGRDDAVGIISNNSTDWAVCFFAASGLGARFVPMYEAELIQVWKYIINDANVKVLFISKKEIFEKLKNIISSIPALKKVIIMEGEGQDTLADIEKKGASRKVKSSYPEQSAICILIYTSGTTGDPKGVLLSHGNITNNVHSSMVSFSDMNENETSLSILPWAHVFGLAELVIFCNLGGSIGIVESATTVAEDLALVKPTFLVAVPRVFNRVYDGLWTKMNEEGGLPRKLFVMGVESAKKKRELAAQGKSSFITNLKFKIADAVVFKKIRAKLGGRLARSMTGSAAMNVEISHFFWDIGIPLYDAYGLTETSPGATMNCPSKFKIGSIGPAMDKCRIVIDQSVVEPGAKDGEIIIYGPNVMQGYYNKPEATAAVMTHDGGFRTGDRGRLDEEGFLFITGRLKEQYKLENGKYVFPVAIEEDIKLNHFIENAMIYGEGHEFNVCIVIPDFAALDKWDKINNLPDGDSVEKIELKSLNAAKKHDQMIKRDDVINFLTNEITNTLKGKYGAYEIPKKFIFISEPFTLDNGMLTQTMKLKRRVVVEKYKDQISALYSK